MTDPYVILILISALLLGFVGGFIGVLTAELMLARMERNKVGVYDEDAKVYTFPGA